MAARLTIVWSADTSDPKNVRCTGVTAEAVSEHGVTHIYDLDKDHPNEVELAMLIAAALGAEVVEVNAHFRPPAAPPQRLVHNSWTCDHGYFVHNSLETCPSGCVPAPRG